MDQADGVAGGGRGNEDRCLYARLLGPAFEGLPRGLREFHRAGGAATGEFLVERGRGAAGVLAALVGAPRAMERAPVVLVLERVGERERWVRTIGGRRFSTVQSARTGRLVERMGPLRFTFEVRVRGEEMVFEQAGFGVLGVPLPRRLSPRVSATARGLDDGWEIDVRVDLPRGGLLCRYSGRMWRT